jgi:hypothetical protein
MTLANSAHAKRAAGDLMTEHRPGKARGAFLRWP